MRRALTAAAILLPTGVGAAPSTALAAGGSVYVANNGSSTVSQYDVGAGGALSPKAPPAVGAGSGPQAVAISPDGKSVYVTNIGSNTLSQYDVGAGGALSPKSTPTVVPGGSGVAISPDGKSLYVTNTGSNSVTQYGVGAGGALSPVATVGAGAAPVGVAVSPDGKSLYVANSGSNTISQYDVGAGGALSLKAIPTVGTQVNPFGVAISPDGKSLYVTNQGSNTISQYDVGAGGALSPRISWGAGTNPEQVAVSPDAKSVYVANQGSNTVSQYDVGGDGTLRPKSTATVSAGPGAAGVAVSPDGKSVYVTNSGSNTVSQYDIGAGGALSPKTSPIADAGLHPFGVAVLPDQGPVASFTASAAPAGSAATFNGSASSDPDGSVVRYDWSFGDGTALANGGPTPSHTYASGGTYTVTLTVTDDAGCSTSQVFTGQTVSCNGTSAAARTQSITIASSPPPRPPGHPPVLARFSLKPSAFRAASSGPTTIKATATKAGTLISYADSQTATTTFTVLQSRKGVRVGGRCVAPPKRRRIKRTLGRCTHLVSLGSFVHADAAGSNSLRFTGRIHGRKLKPGPYRLRAVAANRVGNTSRQITKRFRIIR